MENAKVNSDNFKCEFLFLFSVFATVSLSVFYSSQASATAVQALEVNSALSASSSTGETRRCSVKVTDVVTLTTH